MTENLLPSPAMLHSYLDIQQSSNPKWLKLATFPPHNQPIGSCFFFSMNSIVLTALLLLSLKQKHHTQSLTFFLSLGPSITWTATLFIPTASPLLASVRHHWPFTFHLECYTNSPSTVFTSHQLFFTPVHLKTAKGCTFLKFSFAHVTLLFPSGLRINCKDFTLHQGLLGSATIRICYRGQVPHCSHVEVHAGSQTVQGFLCASLQMTLLPSMSFFHHFHFPSSLHPSHLHLSSSSSNATFTHSLLYFLQLEQSFVWSPITFYLFLSSVQVSKYLLSSYSVREYTGSGDIERNTDMLTIFVYLIV